MSQLQTYSPEIMMTSEEKEAYEVLQDPLLKMTPKEAYDSVSKGPRLTLSQLNAQVAKLTQIVVALNTKI